MSSLYIRNYTLILRMLAKILANYILKYFPLFVSENKVWYFIQIVSQGDNLHEISNIIFWKKKKKEKNRKNISKYHLLNFLPWMRSVNSFCTLETKLQQNRSHLLHPVITLNIGTQASANSVDPDQTPQNVASDQGLHCLPLIKHYFRHINS